MLEAFWTHFTSFVTATWSLWLDAAPWLVIGLVVAGLMKALVPADRLRRWLGGNGVMPVIKAAVIGTPLPLCSCSVLPAAMQLRRSGASKASTVSFLVSTPENGADSIAISYALLGPFMAVARPVAGLLSATAAGLAVMGFVREVEGGAGAGVAGGEGACRGGGGGCCGGGGKHQHAHAHDHDHDHEHEHRQHRAAGGHACCNQQPAQQPQANAASTAPAKSCCSHTEATPAATPSSSCCSSESSPSASSSCCHSGDATDPAGGVMARMAQGIRYTFTSLLDDLALWLLVGLVAAGLVAAFVPAAWLAEHGQGPLAMLVMLLIGVPMYICATSSTPVAAALIAAGVSPGTALVFLLAGPATNLGSLGIIRREIGTAATAVYLGAVAVTSIAAGLIADAIIGAWSLDIAAGIGEGHAHRMMPAVFAWSAAIALPLLMVKPLRQAVTGLWSRSPRPAEATAGS